jgi:putative transposase
MSHVFQEDTLEALRLALHEFQRQYNETWLIGRHGYKAPAQVRHEQCCASGVKVR